MNDVEFRLNENNKVTEKIRSKDDYENMMFKDSLSNKINEDRIEPEILDQYRKNPYTQPLDSHGVCT